MSTKRKKNRIPEWTVGGMCLLAAAIYFSTDVDDFLGRGLTSSKSTVSQKGEDGIRHELREGPDKLRRHRIQRTSVKLPEDSRIEKKLDNLYATTIGAELGPFDEMAHAPKFKKFIEEEGVQGVRALSKLYSKLRLSNDPKFFDLQLLLPKVFHEYYLLGSLGSMVDVIDAIRSSASSEGKAPSENLLIDLMNSFGLDQVNSVRIYKEICATIPEQGYGQYLGTIAGHAGRWMGYDKALAMLPMESASEDREVMNAFNGLIGAWVFTDAGACRNFIESLPDGQDKNSYLAAFAKGLAGFGKRSEAEAVLAGLPTDSQEAREVRKSIEDYEKLPH